VKTVARATIAARVRRAAWKVKESRHERRS
jgi:hypothetical protein